MLICHPRLSGETADLSPHKDVMTEILRNINMVEYRGRMVSREDLLAQIERIQTLEGQGIHWVEPSGIEDNPSEWVEDELVILAEALNEIIDGEI